MTAPLSAHRPIHRWKESALMTLMGLILLLTGTFSGVAWSAYLHPFTTTFPTKAGYARSCLCAVMALVLGQRERVSFVDGAILKAAFLLTLVADYFLILNRQMMIGTVIFLGVHAALIVRHGRGLRESVEGEARVRTIVALALSGAVVYGGTGALLWSFSAELRARGQFTVDCIYLAVLATSLWTAWGTLTRKHYPVSNRWLVAVGMTFFYFCDVSVGLAYALQGSPRGAILDNLVDFFYSPALVLLALSGYRFREDRLPRLLAWVEAELPGRPDGEPAEVPLASGDR